MSDERTRPGGELAAVVATGAVSVLVTWVWAAGGLAFWTATGRWPALQWADVPHALGRLASHPGDPALAWDRVGRAAGGGGQVAAGLGRASGPGPWLFYGWAAALGLVLAVLCALAVRGWLWGRRTPRAVRSSRAGSPSGSAVGRRRRGTGARWATPRDLGSLLVRHPGRSGRLVLGTIGRGRRLVATEARHSVLVIGPTQSGKTTGLAIPAILEWRGPVVATSVKDDLAGRTLAWRAARGPCSVFYPTAPPGQGLTRWSPLAGCTSWSAAQHMAGWLVESTPGRNGLADAAFWYSAAAKQLGPLLFAAERGGLPMAEVVAWTDAQEFDEPIRLLQISGEEEAARALSACASRDDRIRSSVATTLETVLAPFGDPVVAASTSRSELDVGELFATGGTLYLCGPSHEQSRVQGLFAALVSTVLAEAYRRAADAGGTLDPPLLLVLDEAANIAPIRDLDTLASTGAGLGIQLVTVCQDLAQLSGRYNAERARTIANNHRAKLLLSGVADLGTLDLISGLAGETAVEEESRTHDLRDGRQTRSRATVMRRLAPTDQLRCTPPGEGVLVYGHLPPVQLRLRPWFQDRELSRRAHAPHPAGWADQPSGRPSG